MKKISRLIALLVVSIMVFALSGIEANAQTPTVVTYDAPQGYPNMSSDFDVTVEGNGVDLYADENYWEEQVSFGYFDFSGTINIDVKVNFPFTEFKILPESLEIEGAKSGDTISFSISQPTKVTIIFDKVEGEIDDQGEIDYHGKIIHLFANELETDVPSPTDPDVIYYEPDYHNLKDTPNERIDVGTGQTLYIAGGAVVNGRIYIKDANNVTVKGRGIVTMDWHEKIDDPDNELIWDVPMFIDTSDHVTLDGIIINRRADNWSGKIVRSNNITVTDYKVVSPTYTSSDGLNLINCNDVLYDDCFFHDCDDNIAIKGVVGDKGYKEDNKPAKGGANCDITIQNSQFWSDANNAIVLGEETQAVYYTNIKYKNLDIMHVNDHEPDMGAISITCLNGTAFRNIVYEDIRVGECNKMILLNFTNNWYNGSLHGNQSYQGYINGITFKDIEATGSGANEIKILGWDDSKQVGGLKFENIKINDEYVESLADPHFNINRFVKTIDISTPSNPSKTYHPGISFSDTQGTDNWYYKEWNGSNYVDMTWISKDKRWKGTDAFLSIWSPVFMHPHTNDAVRAWKAPESGDILIKGVVQKWDTRGGDGVRLKIMKNNTQIWPNSGWLDLGYDNKVGHYHSVNTTVAEDDMIYFVVNQNNNGFFDSTFWDANISYNPNYNAATDFGTYQNAFGWSYLEWDGTSYSNMTWDSTNSRWQGSNTYSRIWDGPYMHPDTYDTVRALYCSNSGTVNIGGVVKDMDEDGDGVRVKIMKNGTQIWPVSGWETVSAGATSSHDFDVTVNAGDTIYFHLNQNSSLIYDTVYWAPNVVYK